MALTASRSGRIGRTASAAVLAALLATVLAPSTLGADSSVGAPVATYAFLDGITFKGSATLGSDVVRVELIIDFEGSQRSTIADVIDVVQTVKPGPANLSYVLPTPGGAILPNTDVTARFRLVLADGSTVVGAPTTVHYEDTRFDWRTTTGEFVRVHWTEGGQSFGRRAASIGDDAIRDISALLGVTETEPIDFFVYADRTAFYDALGPGTPENVGGEAHADIRTLFANIDAATVDDPWVGIVIPHELNHLVFDSAVTNAYHYPPRWLNEGIAVYLSEGFGRSDRNAIRDAVRAGEIMPLGALNASFPTTEDRFYLAYSESVSAVSFLVDRYGRDAMVQIVRAYADGVSDDEAFTAALGLDVAGFEAAWLTSIGAPTPSPFGPQPAPAGPVPPDWGGPAATPGAIPEESPGPSPTPRPGSDGERPDGGIGWPILALGAAVLVIAIRLRRSAATRAPTPLPEDPAAHVPGDAERDAAGDAERDAAGDAVMPPSGPSSPEDGAVDEEPPA